MVYKKIGVITLSSAIVLSGVIPASTGFAETNSVAATVQAIPVPGQSEENNSLDVDKATLLAKVNSLFPKQFNFLSEKDFHINFNPARPGYESGSYSLSFFKDLGGNRQINGHFEFAGKDMTLVSYYYDPADKSEALFPPKITKEQAQTIAKKFLENVKLKESYQLSEEDIFFNSNVNRPLTEPVEYNFMFDKLENGVPVQFQNVNITVLGNGEVTQFYNGNSSGETVFENKDNIIAKADALQTITDNLRVDLRYLIDYNYMNDTASVSLTYLPEPTIIGIHAKTKEFKIGDKFFKDLPKEQDLTMLGSSTAQKSAKPITKEEAKALAEKLLKPKEDNVKLAIEGIEEIERNGTKMYNIQFMYYTGSGGSGSSLEINKQTGEILNYHNQNREFYFPNQPDTKEIKPKLTEAEALKKAVNYVKQYASANLGQYAYPVEAADSSYRKEGNEFYFRFPRLKDGIIVNGNSIDVSVSADDGELYSLNVNHTEVDKWPELYKAVDQQAALNAIKENIDVKLYYVPNTFGQNDQYRLVYTVQQKEGNTYFDAIAGKWQKFSYAGEIEPKEKPVIDHPWASDELNFLLKANIIKVDNPATFNPDRPVTKGEAIEVLYKSLAYDYPGYFHEEQIPSHETFENIKPDHPLYKIIERAVAQKILDTTMKTFNTEEKLTKEELAFWYARALGLQLVADQDELYNMNFADTKQMNEQYKGHIALVNGLGILTKNANQQFEPKKEVTLAELAVSNVRLAKIASQMNVNFR